MSDAILGIDASSSGAIIEQRKQFGCATDAENTVGDKCAEER